MGGNAAQSTNKYANLNRPQALQSRVPVKLAHTFKQRNQMLIEHPQMMKNVGRTVNEIKASEVP